MTESQLSNSQNIINTGDLPFTPGAVVKPPSLLDDSTRKNAWQEQLVEGSVPKVVDLFCGAGGLSTGFANAGFAVAVAIDNDPFAVQTFAANIPAKTFCRDIMALDDPESLVSNLNYSSIDVVVGGPPCQGFSIAGRSKIRSLEDQDQVRLFARNDLFQDFFRFLETFQPRFFLLENVVGLLSFANGAYIDAIEEESDRLGYTLETKIIDAAELGVPQFRRRLFVVGSRVGRLFQWPRTIAEQDRVTVLDAIGDLPVVMPPSLIECLPYRPKEPLSLFQQLMRSRVSSSERNRIYDHVVRPVRDDDRIIFMNMKPGDRYIDIDPRYRRYDDSKFKDKYYMLKPDEPGNTITAHIAKDGYRYIHWDTSQHRTLSVREAARIQSFGDHFRFAGSRSSRFRQIGNAVPPLLAENLAKQMYRAWLRSKGVLQPSDAIQPALPVSGWERYSHLKDSTE